VLIIAKYSQKSTEQKQTRLVSSSSCDAKRLVEASRRCRTACPPLAAGPQSLWHLCRGRSGGSRMMMVSGRPLTRLHYC